MQSFFLGADVSKGYADFVILNEHKQRVVQNFQLDDTHRGHQRLLDIVNGFLKQHPGAALFAAVESTGGYENNWYHCLQQLHHRLDVSVARLNPLGVTHNSKAKLQRNRTDKLSACSVAEYLIAHPEKVTYQRRDPWAGLKKQWGFIKMLTKQSTQLRNQLESLLYTANPELIRYCKDGVPAWVLKLLVKYPTAAQLARARVSALAKIPYVPEKRARELIASAKHSVASATDPVSENLVQDTARQILSQKQTIDAQTTAMLARCSIPQVALLKTFPGISDLSAVGLMLEIQSVDRFSSVKNLASFFGLHPVFKTSGDGQSGFKMSKQGRKEPRRILFLTALTAIRCSPLIRDIFEEHLGRGKCKMDAIGVCMHKILRIIYGMLKHNTAFDPQIDLRNRTRNADRSAAPAKDKTRRFQNYDPQAPISARQNKKRLERKQPQCAANTTSGVIAAVPEPVA